MSGHTPTPWRNIRGHVFSDVLLRNGSHDVCAMTIVNNDVIRAEANAALIVKAANSHDALVTALKFYADHGRYDGPNQRLIGKDPFTPKDQGYLQDVTRDCGAIAREAIAKILP